MGLLAALRDRLFGPPAPLNEGAGGAAEPAADVGEPTPAPVESLVDPAAPVGTDTSASEDMPRRRADQESGRAANDDEAVAARQERVASRILEDERLRGDLADDEFQPLLDWAMTAADGLAASTAGLSDEQADRRIEGGMQAIKEAVAAAGDAIAAYAEHDPERLKQALADAGIGARDQRSDASVARMLSEQDLPGPVVAALIVSRLRSVVPDDSNRTRRGSS